MNLNCGRFFISLYYIHLFKIDFYSYCMYGKFMCVSIQNGFNERVTNNILDIGINGVGIKYILFNSSTNFLFLYEKYTLKLSDEKVLIFVIITLQGEKTIITLQTETMSRCAFGQVLKISSLANWTNPMQKKNIQHFQSDHKTDWMHSHHYEDKRHKREEY